MIANAEALLLRASEMAAEDALSEAFASALDDWPRNGVPANPEGWLMTGGAAKNHRWLSRAAAG
jgi:RNA polymerase sigma-70 factor (ECF subfamily)